jgi:hypothetical protein
MGLGGALAVAGGFGTVAAHGLGIGTFIRDPRGATRDFFANLTPGQVAMYGVGLALERLLPAGVRPALGRRARRAVTESAEEAAEAATKRGAREGVDSGTQRGVREAGEHATREGTVRGGREVADLIDETAATFTNKERAVADLLAGEGKTDRAIAPLSEDCRCTRRWNRDRVQELQPGRFEPNGEGRVDKRKIRRGKPSLK